MFATRDTCAFCDVRSNAVCIGMDKRQRRNVKLFNRAGNGEIDMESKPDRESGRWMEMSQNVKLNSPLYQSI